MKNISLIEKAIIKALLVYMDKEGLHQIELAKRLGWSPSDLNDTLKGRKGIGKHRQTYLEEKLGSSFKNELILEISELSGPRQKKRVAKSARCVVGKYTLTDAEQKYVEKLLAIFRGLNKQAKLAIQMNINALYPLIKNNQQITEKDIRLMLEEFVK